MVTYTLEDLYDGTLLLEFDRRMNYAAFIPNPWQADVLADEHRFIVVALPRKSGKTALAVAWLLKNAQPYDMCCYVSTTFDVQETVTIPELLAQCPDAVYYSSKQTVLLPNGATVKLTYAMDPASINRQRGKSRFRIWVFDEAGFYVNRYMSIKWADVGAMQNSIALIVSTKWPDSEFEHICLHVAPDNPDEYALYDNLDFLDTRPPHMSLEERTKQRDVYKDMMMPQEYAREILNQWGDREGAVFTNSELCLERGKGLPKLDPSYPYALGLDLGNSNDYTVLTAMSASGATYILLRTRGSGYHAQVDMIKRIVSGLPNALPIWTDATGLGAVVMEILANAGLKAFAVDFGSHIPGEDRTWKDYLTGKMITAHERGEIAVYPDELGNLFVQESRSFVYKLGVTPGRYTYGAAPGMHDDIVCSVMLANAARERIPLTLKRPTVPSISKKPAYIPQSTHRQAIG